MMLEIDDLFPEIIINLSADATIRSSGWNEGIEPGFFVSEIPFFKSAGRIVAKGTIRSFDPFG
jgi:hypothetical protein